MARRWYRSLARRIFANFWLKIASLAVTVVIWISVTGQERTDKTFMNIPYEIRNIPLNMAVTERGEGFVRVTIRGPQNLITTLKPENISVVANLPDSVTEGEIRMELTHSNVSTPYSNQLSILQIGPGEITIKLQKTTTRMVAIKPFIRGAPAEYHELGPWEVIPPNVQIKGPVDTLDRIDSILTDPIEISGVTMTFNERVGLQPNDNQVRVVSPQRVTVKIAIREKMLERSFPEFLFSILQPHPDAELTASPSVVTLILSGPQRIVGTLQPHEVEVVADCTHLEPGSHMVPLLLESSFSEQLNFSTDPAAVEVHVPTPKPEPTPTPEMIPVSP